MATQPQTDEFEPVPQRGRPSSFTQQIADEICDRIALGESLIEIASDDHMPDRVTVYRWLWSGKHEDFRNAYARAREAQADSLFDEMQTIADDGANDWMEKRSADGAMIGWQLNGEAVARSKLRLEDRRWRAGKLRPKTYGDATMLKHANAEGEVIRTVIDPSLLSADERDILRQLTLAAQQRALAPPEDAEYQELGDDEG